MADGDIVRRAKQGRKYNELKKQLQSKVTYGYQHLAPSLLRINLEDYKKTKLWGRRLHEIEIRKGGCPNPQRRQPPATTRRPEY